MKRVATGVVEQAGQALEKGGQAIGKGFETAKDFVVDHVPIPGT